MATPTAIHTGLDVAAERAAPTPAPIATPTPALAPEVLLVTNTTVSRDSSETFSTTIRRHGYVPLSASGSRLEIRYSWSVSQGQIPRSMMLCMRGDCGYPFVCRIWIVLSIATKRGLMSESAITIAHWSPVSETVVRSR
jgi:hypothetical protein